MTESIRAAAGLVFWPADGALVAVAYRSRKALKLPMPWVQWLVGLSEPMSFKAAQERARELGCSEPVEQGIAQLRERGFVLSAEEAEADQRWWKAWKWGHVAGLVHFSNRDIEWADDAQEAEVLASVYRPDEQMWTPPGKDAFALPSPSSDALNEVFKARHSCRAFSDASIELAALSNCLWSGLGFRGFIDLPNRPRLPAKMTPSAGARNPYEAYVISQRVNGLAPGVYHYAGVQHSLERVASCPDRGQLLHAFGGQTYFGDAAAIVVLVANFDRMMAKYALSNSYGLVLIEAGHIFQNLVVRAAEEKIGACTSGALMHSELESLLGLTASPFAGVTYAAALGHESILVGS